MASILDHPIISERYFFPRPVKVMDPFWVEVPGARLCCKQVMVDPKAPWLLHFHGNGEVVADYVGDFAQAIGGLGLNLFLAEYRGYGGSTGTPMLHTMLADSVAVLDAMKVPSEQVVVYGRSVGSLYAIEVAAQRKVKGLIIESGIADILQRLSIRMEPEEIGVSAEALQQAARASFNHKEKLGKNTAPTVVIHAQRDSMVGFEHAEANARWSGGKLVGFTKGDHNTIMAMNMPAILKVVQDVAGL